MVRLSWSFRSSPASFSLLHGLVAMFGLREAFTILTLSISFVLGQDLTDSISTIPFTVRTPYFNSHMMNPDKEWAKHWSSKQSIPWDLCIMVDGEHLQLFGKEFGTPTNRTNIEITPTRSIVEIQANTVNVTVTFLSPIEPDNLVLQSLPFVYIYMDITSNDGQEHSIQIYSDVTGEWLSGDMNSEILWDSVKSNSLIYHYASRKSPSMDEISDMAEDSTLYYAYPNGQNVTYRTGGGNRALWAKARKLDNTESRRFRPIQQEWATFAFAHDLGDITSTQEPLMWAFGLVRTPNIKYRSQERYPYFWTKYSTIHGAITDFVGDFKDARDRAVAFDTALQSEARNVSEQYADLVSMTARQALAGVEITVSKTEDGNWNASDVMSFMKDIGVSRRASPVHVLYSAFPAFLKLNATWAGYLLEPLLRAQNYIDGPAYAIPDLGTSYPVATADLSPSAEKSVAKDASFLKAYYGLLKKWASYLVAQRTELAKFTDQDGLSNSNLALKSILGIKCMAAIADAVGRGEDSASFTANATSIYAEWKDKAIMEGHIVSRYGVASSWSLMYNMFYDRLLGIDLVDESIVTQQDTFYKTLISSSGGPFGIRYDSSVGETSISSWSMFSAGATLDNEVRDMLLSGVHARAVFNGSSDVFPSGYSAQDGSTSFGQASPVQGAIFSLLALNLQRKTPKGGGEIQETSENRPSDEGPAQVEQDKKSSNHILLPAIIGGVVGGLVLTVLLAAGCLFYRRRKIRLMNEKPVPYPFMNRRSNAQTIDTFLQTAVHQLLFMFSGSQHSGSPKRGPCTTSPIGGRCGDTRSPSSRGQPDVGLRSDVENLRRELDQIREHTLFLAPPEYDAAAR